MTSGLDCFALLTIMSVAYAAVVGSIERLRLVVTSGTVPSMTSVWALAGSVVLTERPFVALLIVVIFAAEWPARRVVAKAHPWRYVYSAATAVLAAVLASSASSALGGAAGAAAAVVVFTSVNMACIAAAMTVAGQRARLRMFISGREQALEIGSLAFGAVVGLGMSWHPAVAILVAPIMAVAHRVDLSEAAEQCGGFDPATGLWSEDAWRVQAQELLRSGRPVSVLVVGPGRGIGENELRIAEVLQELRPGDPRGHYGRGIALACEVRTAAAGEWLAESIRLRLAEIGVAGVVGSACGAGTLVDLLMAAMSDVMVRRSVADPSVGVADVV